jgi:protein tyrosine/serine phosphatase
VAGGAASASWAEPMEHPGLPNLHRVSEDLYRGAQPTAAGIRQLEALGIRTIVNLRTSDTDDRLLEGSGLAYERIPMTAWQPRDRDVVQFLRIVTDENRRPVFLHCRRGADRTGMMVAVYRMAVQGWEKEQALAEMTQGGFRFNSGWRNLVQYVRDLDIDAIRQQAGLGEPTNVR